MSPLLATEGIDNDSINGWSAMISLSCQEKGRGSRFREHWNAVNEARSIWHIQTTTSNHSQPIIQHDHISSFNSRPSLSYIAPSELSVRHEVNTIRAPDTLFARVYAVLTCKLVDNNILYTAHCLIAYACGFPVIYLQISRPMIYSRSRCIAALYTWWCL